VKHIVNISGGMASAVCLFRVIDRFGRDDTQAVFADTNSEDADLYRFLADVERVPGLRAYLGGSHHGRWRDQQPGMPRVPQHGRGNRRAARTGMKTLILAVMLLPLTAFAATPGLDGWEWQEGLPMHEMMPEARGAFIDNEQCVVEETAQKDVWLVWLRTEPGSQKQVLAGTVRLVDYRVRHETYDEVMGTPTIYREMLLTWNDSRAQRVGWLLAGRGCSTEKAVQMCVDKLIGARRHGGDPVM
jgi:hypothetical protein